METKSRQFIKQSMSIILVLFLAKLGTYYSQNNLPWSRELLVVSSVCYDRVCVPELLVGEDDLHDVMSAVADLAGRWKNLGISLGVRPSELNSIHYANLQFYSSCLREMLILWLRQSYNVCIPLYN